MRILFINKFLYPRGGAETYMLDLARELTARGHEVQFFGMYDEKNTVGNQAGAYAKAVDFHTSGPEKLLYPFSILYSRDAKAKVLRVIDDFKPEIAHLHNINFQLTPSIIDTLHERRIPMVMTAHDFQLVCPNHMLYVPGSGELCSACVEHLSTKCIREKCIHHSALRSAIGYLEAKIYRARDTYDYIDRIICPSRFMKETLDRQDRFASKTVFLRNYSKEYPVRKTSKKDYVLYFGRLSEEKGIANLITAMKALPDIPFVVAGDGPMHDALDGIRNVRYVGYKTGEDLEKLVREAKFTVCPSIWYENCPLSVIESQKMGTPCLAVGIGGAAELVGPEYCIPDTTAASLIKAIKELYGSSEKLAEMTASLAERVLAYPTLEEYAQEMESMYDEFCPPRIPEATDKQREKEG